MKTCSFIAAWLSLVPLLPAEERLVDLSVANMEDAVSIDVASIGQVTRLKLPEQIEGRKQTLRVSLQNSTGHSFQNLVARISCVCVSAKIVENTSLKAGQTGQLEITIMPPRDELREQVTLYGSIAGDEQNTLTRITAVAINADSLPPLRFANDRLFLDQDNTSTIASIIPAHAALEITDLTRVRLNSEFLEVRAIKKKDANYELVIGLVEGRQRPDKDISAILTAPFSYPGGQEMQMQEVLYFLTESRVELVPRFARLSPVPRSQLASFQRFTANVLLKNQTGKPGDFKGLLVTNRSGYPFILDPDIITGISRIGKSNAIRLSLSATVYDGLVEDDMFFLLFHQSDTAVDLTLPWEEFFDKFDVFPAYSIND